MHCDRERGRGHDEADSASWQDQRSDGALWQPLGVASLDLADWGAGRHEPIAIACGLACFAALQEERRA